MTKVFSIFALCCGLSIAPAMAADKAKTSQHGEVIRTKLVTNFHAKNTKVFSVFVKGFC